MTTIVLGLAVADFTTGIIKGYVTNQLNSQKMRRGGINKLGELIVMATACGLEFGIRMLGCYYDTPALAAVTGTVTASAVFIYIVIMELISILENYGEINSQAAWVRHLVKKLKNINRKDDDQ